MTTRPAARSAQPLKAAPTCAASPALPSVTAADFSQHYPCFDDLPDSALVRQDQLIRNPKKPGVPVPLPFAHATFWRKVAAGTFPKPTKLGNRITAWKVGEVREWINTQAHVTSATD